MILRTISLALFSLAFAVILLTYGGVYSAPVALAVLLLTACLVTAGIGRGLHADTFVVFGVVLVMWILLSVWIVVQALPLPAGLFANTAWRTLQDANIEVAGSISVAPGETLASLLPISLPFLTLLCTLLLFRTDQQVELALRVLGICGCAFALFAIVQFALFPNMVMFATKRFYLGTLTAPFVNRNTAATFYGLVALALITSFALALKPAGRSRRKGEGRDNGWLPLALLLMTLPVVVALALTASRAGAASSLAGAGVLLTALALDLSKRQAFPIAGWGFRRSVTGALPGRWRRWGIVALVLAALMVVAALAFGRTFLRAEVRGTEDGRYCIMSGLMQALGENFNTGIGPGSFTSYFPAYRDPRCGMDTTWTMAHNFYVDVSLALGVPVATVLFIAAFALLAFSFGRGLRRRKSKRIVVISGIAAVLTVSLHAIPDFSLQIPGFAMVFALFIGLTVTVSLNFPGKRQG